MGPQRGGPEVASQVPSHNMALARCVLMTYLPCCIDRLGHILHHDCALQRAQLHHFGRRLLDLHPAAVLAGQRRQRVFELLQCFVGLRVQCSGSRLPWLATDLPVFACAYFCLILHVRRVIPRCQLSSVHRWQPRGLVRDQCLCTVCSCSR